MIPVGHVIRAEDLPAGRSGGVLSKLNQTYRSSSLTLEEFEGRRYQRIKHIKKLMAEGIVGADLATRDLGQGALRPWRGPFFLRG
jgi:hypothetical protein